MALGAPVRIVLALLCCALVGAGPAGAAPADGPDRARTVAVRTDAVKGDFPDAAAWAKARTAAPFLVAGNTDVARNNSVNVLYDDKALYVRARVNDPAVNKLKPLRQGRPGFSGVWNNDCVELFLGSPTDPKAKLHLAVDMLGQRYQNPKTAWRSTVNRDAKGYTVLFAVPFEAVGWGNPARGRAWKIKVGHESKTGLGNSMWPLNFSGGFHSEKAWALLYFGTDNLLSDGGFEKLGAGGLKRRGGAWRFTHGYGKDANTGTAEVVRSPLPDGGHALRLHKTKAQPSWYPYLMYARHLPLAKGRSYVASAWVRTAKPWVLRVYFHKEGVRRHIKALRIKQRASPDKMRYFEVPFVMPEEADTSYPGVRFANAETGSLVVDNFVVREDPLSQAVAGAREGESHPVHNLLELAKRGRILPAYLRREGLKTYPSERLLFKDTATGATIWKLTRWPGESRHQYANMLCWNANAGLLKMFSTRARNLLLTSDGRRMYKLPVPDADWIAKWCPVDPARLYVQEYRGDKQVFYAYDVERNTKRYLPGVYPRRRTSLWVPHPDGKRLIIVDNSQSPTAETSHGYVINPDTGERVVFDFQGVTHQVWFTKRKDYLIYFGYESANKRYTAKRRGAWLINPDGTSLRKVYDPKWVHRDFSPDGKRVAFHGVGLRIVNVIDGGDEVQASSHSGGHCTWQTTPEWFVSSTQGVLRCVGAQGQGFDYVLCHSRFQSPLDNFGGRQRPCSSPDGTKVAYSSTMSGDWDFYNVVSRLPHPPRQVRCRVEGARVRLTWQPPKFHRETKGYFVYWSPESGGEYRQVNAAPVVETTFTDRLPRGATHAFYVVSSVERCGLEGRLSEEVCASPDGTWSGPVRRYFEMEDCRPVKPLMEFFDPAASRMYVMRMDRGNGGRARMRIRIPAARRYAVWLRLKADPDACAVTLRRQRQRLVAKGLKSAKYAWTRLGLLDLPQGGSDLDFEVSGKRSRLDALFITDAQGDRPKDSLLWDATPPAQPRGLRANKAGKSHIALSWQPVKDPDVAHYNVYASRKPAFRVSQKRLIASPIDPRYTDWGLRLGTKYHYKVCAVDRRGNRSEPSAELVAETTKAAPFVAVRKSLGPVRPGLPPKTSKSRKRLETMGAFAVRAHRLTKSTALSVDLDVPADGDYVLWVKYALIKRKGGSSIRLVADKQVGQVGWSLRYVAASYSAPSAAVFVWEPAQTGVGRYNHTRVFRLRKGRVAVAVSARSDSELEVAEVLLTNDLGLQPDGIHCWRPGNPKWLKE